MNFIKSLIAIFVVIGSSCSERVVVENGFKEINGFVGGYSVRIFLSPFWGDKGGGSPYLLGVWITPGDLMKKLDCEVEVRNFRIKDSRKIIIFYNENAEAEVLGIKGREGVMVVRLEGRISLADEDHEIEFDLYSEDCVFDFNFKAGLNYFKKEKKVRFWDVLMGV